MWIEGAGTLIDDSGGEYGAGIKQSLLRTRNLALAVTGSMRKFVGSGSERLMAIGAVGTLCVDDSCTFELSGSFSRVWSRFESDFETSDRGENLVTVSVSVGNASTRFLAEALEVEGEGVGFLGLRFGNRTWAVDLGLVRPLAGPFVGGETDIPALPWIAVSARL